LSSQKSGWLVSFSIRSISPFSLSGSKTPPGFFDPFPEGMEFLFELS
jgi:hypothetical protein